MYKLIILIGTIIVCIFLISYANNSRIVKANSFSGTTVYRIGTFKSGEIQTFNTGNYHFIQAVNYDNGGVAVKQCNSLASNATVYNIGSLKEEKSIHLEQVGRIL